MNLEKEIKIYTKLTIVPKLHIFLKDGTKLKKKIKDQNHGYKIKRESKLQFSLFSLIQNCHSISLKLTSLIVFKYWRLKVATKWKFILSRLSHSYKTLLHHLLLSDLLLLHPIHYWDFHPFHCAQLWTFVMHYHELLLKSLLFLSQHGRDVAHGDHHRLLQR